MTDPEPQDIQSQIHDVMARLQRIAPELIRYAWLGQGMHDPAPEHAILGLTKVQVQWSKIVHEGLEIPEWTSAALLARAMEEAGVRFSDQQRESLARDTQAFTTVRIRYWAEGVPGARYVSYKCLCSGGGNDDGKTQD